MRKRNTLWFILIILIAVGAAAVIRTPYLTNDDSENITLTITPVVGPHVKINTASILVELASSTTAIKKGLSGRNFLAANAGMLFIFPKPYRYSFWMKDMQFPLDMLWINEGRVVDITPHATNDFTIAAPVFYQPKTPAQYVLEVNAGVAATHNIKIGDAVLFKNIDL